MCNSFLILLILGFFSYKTYKTNRIYTFSFLFFLMSIAYALNFYTLVAGIVMDKYNFIAFVVFVVLAVFFILLFPFDFKFSLVLVKAEFNFSCLIYAECYISNTPHFNF